MKLILRLALDEIKSNKRYSLLFIFQLCLGISGFILLNSFRDSFNQHLTQRSRSLLTSDISVSARRSLSAEEISTADKILGSKTQALNVISIYSMVSSETMTRLVEIKAIEPGWPGYGTLSLDSSDPVSETERHRFHSSPALWVWPEVLVQTDSKPGDTLKIGGRDFTIAGVVKDDPGSLQTGVSYAPRVYVNHEQFKQTGLIRKGSTYWHTRYYTLKESSEPILEAKTTELNKALTDPGIRISNHLLKGQRSGRMLRYLFDYLGLVALAGFFLSALGIAYFYFTWLNRRLKNYAIFMSLGISSAQIINTLMVQIILLSLASALISIAFIGSVLPFVPDFISGVYKIDLEPAITSGAVLFTILQSLVGSLFICYPFFRKMRSLNPSGLFHENESFSMSLTLRDCFHFLPALLLYWILAVQISHSWFTGSLFTAGFAGSALILTILFMGISKLLARYPTRIIFTLRTALLYLTRKPAQSLTAFLAISLASLLINMIIQIDSGLSEETGTQNKGNRPDFFLFDIQDEQTEPLQQFLNHQNLTLSWLSPMVSSRLVAINQKEFIKSTDTGETMTREEEQSGRMRNRSYNLSWRSELFPSEKLLKGTLSPNPWNPDQGNSMPEMSLETRFAKRLNVNLGDTMTFDVQGVEVEGRITSLRQIRWTSFQPNFFIQFQPGVLEDAPKTWLAGIIADTGQKATIQKNLVADFPNISIIDVERLLNKISQISDWMKKILLTMSSLTLFTGFIILFFICQFQTRLRIRDMQILHALGTSPGVIRRTISLEFALLSFAASGLGGLVAIGLSRILSRQIFDADWSPVINIPLILTVSSTAIAAFSAWMIALNTVKKNLNQEHW